MLVLAYFHDLPRPQLDLDDRAVKLKQTMALSELSVPGGRLGQGLGGGLHDEFPRRE